MIIKKEGLKKLGEKPPPELNPRLHYEKPRAMLI
jgi:hypothetical protein